MEEEFKDEGDDLKVKDELVSLIQQTANQEKSQEAEEIFQDNKTLDQKYPLLSLTSITDYSFF